MKNIVKANIVCILKNTYFRIGLVIAVTATAMFTAYGAEYTVFVSSKNNMMIVISAAILGFVATFTPYMTHMEYSDGVIRNKVIAGHSQTKIYLSHLSSQMFAAFLMVICWFAGGILGGASINRNLVMYTLIILFASFAFVSLLTLCGMKTKKKNVANFIGVFIFYILINMMLIGNACVTFSKGVLHVIAKFVYHLSPLGQWFVRTYISGEFYQYPVAVELGISVLVCVCLTYLGTRKINKRDL